MMLMVMTPEARRQGFGFEEGLLLSETPDLRHPITLTLSLTLTLSTGAKTLDTNQQK